MPSNAKPLEYLGESIKVLAKADVAVFAPNCLTARGCVIEYDCAKAYNIAVIQLFKNENDKLTIDARLSNTKYLKNNILNGVE